MLELRNAHERASVSASVHAASRIGLCVLQRRFRFQAEQASAEKTPSITLNRSLDSTDTFTCSNYAVCVFVMGVVKTFAHD